MRPIELSLACFGAYREPVKVDFSELGPLFLVWGKTGSGKSTLFDAMCYALYGEAPGGRKGLSRELRSHYASAEEEPWVQFTFALGARSWRARRTPPWSKTGKRGRPVEVPQDAVLESLVEGSWRLEASGPRDVDVRVRELLGLSAEEFSKIILLPQGEFQRFLDMSSTERVAILEKLFPVGLHDRATSIAVERAKTAVAEARRLDEEIRRIGSEGGGVEAEAELTRLGAEEARVGEELEALLRERIEGEKALARGREDAARRQELQRSLARLGRAQAAMVEGEGLVLRIGAARRSQSALPRLDEAARAGREAAVARKTLESRAAELAEHEAGRPAIVRDRSRGKELEGELAALAKGIGELKPALEAWNQLALARAKTGRLRETMALRAARIAEARSAAEKAQKAFEAERIGIDDIERARKDYEAARSALDKAKSLARLVEQTSRAAIAMDEAGIAALQAEKKLAFCESELAAHLRRREKGLAFELASRLEAGSPCPVCGSTEHPAPASSEVIESAADIEASRKSRDLALAGRAAAEEQLFHKRGAFSEAVAELESLGYLWKETIDGESAGRILSAGETEAAAKEALHRGALERKGREEALSVRREAAVAELGALEAAEGRDREALAAAEAELAGHIARAGEVDPRMRLDELESRRKKVDVELGETRSRIEDWEKALGSFSARHAESAARQPTLDAVASEAAALAREALEASNFAAEEEARAAALGHEALAALEEKLHAMQMELAAATAAVESARRSVGEGPEPDLVALEAAVSEIAERHGGLAAVLEGLRSSRQGLENLVGRRRALEAERAAMGDEALRLELLANLLAGRLSSRKLPFKNWALAAWFRTVVDRASYRLSELSDGRYTLAADEGQGLTQGRRGLELLVRDAWTGRARPAGTLSGGERFLSSLALALGLADSIRSRSGGVSLDAVFVDEGFGSLDDEALDRAIGALDVARGGRMIGIVSHVAELRNRIPSRIEVRKGRLGSSVEIVNS